MVHYIYALVDPRNNKPFYIGITNNPKRRLAHHISTCNRPKGKWQRLNTNQRRISEIISSGHKPQMEIVETHTDYKTLRYRELYMIGKYEYIYGKLTNSQSGYSDYEHEIKGIPLLEHFKRNWEK